MIKRSWLIAATATLAMLAGGCATPASSPENDYADLVMRADRAGVTFAQATAVIPALDTNQAYTIQHRLVDRRIKAGDAVAGFKSGLMSAKSLTDRKAAQPLVGALFRSGSVHTGTMVSLCGYRRPALEMKLGFVFNRPVRERLGSIDALKARVGGIAPIVELPDIAYADGKNYLALDMIAANISAARYVRAGTVPVPASDIDQLPVEITRDGLRVTRGLGRESLDGQWSSLLTVVNILV
ncbi:MAG: hypothetical protein RIS85_418, partial [Pseudomonadota bacterium]